jgi:hypothetical protein
MTMEGRIPESNLELNRVGLVPRGLWSDKLTGKTSFSGHQIRTILIVAAVCSVVSLLSTLVACYWFVRMKRGFRHQYVIEFRG